MDILARIRKMSVYDKDRAAIVGSDNILSYGEIEIYSDRLSVWIRENTEKDSKKPVVVYGHKSAYMLVAFLACVKAGRAYVPQDISIPEQRVRDTIKKVDPELVFNVEERYFINDLEKNTSVIGTSGIDIVKTVSRNDLMDIVTNPNYVIDELADRPVEKDEVFYIIFTSGSTGTPKGVQITRGCLESFLEWSEKLVNGVEEKEEEWPEKMHFLNQAPFSFDLSVMDLYTALATGGTLYTLTKEQQSDYGEMFKYFEKSDLNVWVSTPSFADMCLRDEKFSEQLIPNIRTFLFCGETLGIATAKKLIERFPKAKVYNTYGPTESTVAVTSVEITKDIINAALEAKESLPVGFAKPNTDIKILSEDGQELRDGETGEVIIAGDSVSIGYYELPEVTKNAFYEIKTDDGIVRAYRTRDAGYLRNGNLYYIGRIDLQIKLHGYRIELEDIENNLEKLDAIDKAVVVPVIKDGLVKSLTAFTVGADESLSAFEYSRNIRQKLKEFLPPYMIPKKVIHLDTLPMTNHGKADRKLLGGMV